MFLRSYGGSSFAGLVGLTHSTSLRQFSLYMETRKTCLAIAQNKDQKPNMQLCEMLGNFR
jgi:hypothetical protein